MTNSVVIDYFSNTIDVNLEEELLLFRGRILKDDPNNQFVQYRIGRYDTLSSSKEA